MAKAKPQSVPETKQKRVKTYVSTSGIFKKIGSHRSIVPASRREPRRREHYNHRFADELVSYVPKKHVPNHPLVTAFGERIERSREYIQANAAALTDSVHHSLTDRLASASAQPDKLIKAGTALKEEKFRPLGEDQLQFASPDGVTKVKALLGDRMQSFRKVVSREEKALAVLRKEWDEVQQEIENFAKETLGPDGLKHFRNSKEIAQGGQCGEQQKKLERDVELDRTRLEQETEKISQQAMQKMLAGEKEMDFLQRKQRKSIMSIWEAQL